MKPRLFTKRLFVAAFSLSIALLVSEVGLRIVAPNLADDLFAPRDAGESPFLYSDRMGYELKPNAWVSFTDCNGTVLRERFNNDGFRGPNRGIPKPNGVFRTLVAGDSVVQALSVSYEHSWESVLERDLNRDSNCFEVINAGVGGYVSWQTLRRVEDRGFKYEPDLILVNVGVNDLAYSSLPNWKPGLNLSQIDQAYNTPSAQSESESGWRKIRIPIYRWLYTARLVRQARNHFWNENRQRELIDARQKPSGVAFNSQALELFVENLNSLYLEATKRKIRVGLVVWGTLLTEELVNDSDVHRRLLMLYSNFPLSTRELNDGYEKYRNAIRGFAARHTDVILIDVAEALASKPKAERLRLFMDHVHYTEEGNKELARIVRESLKRYELVK